MAFKKMTEYNEEKFGNFFRLVNDNDYADVIFLYRSTHDVLIADVHYAKLPEYSGYVQCLERGCPACADGIRKQSKLFIPMLVVSHCDPDFKGPKLQFWDRSTRFQAKLMSDVFRAYPNPSEVIFRITRHGQANSVDTQYSIRAVRPAIEEFGSYDKILADNRIIFPDSYELVCKDYNAFELRTMLDAPRDGSTVSSSNNYGAAPRRGYSSAEDTAVPDVSAAANTSFSYVTPPSIADVPEVEIPEIGTALGEDVSLDVDTIADAPDF